MATCDLCGKEFDYDPEIVNLYRANLLERDISDKILTTSRISSEYGQFKQVQVKVCRKHRLELLVQRLMPGVFSFLLLFFPIGFLISRFHNFGGANIQILYEITAVVTVVASAFIVRLITFDGLVATGLTGLEKQKQSQVEYLTAKKYQRITNPKKGKFAAAVSRDKKARKR